MATLRKILDPNFVYWSDSSTIYDDLDQLPILHPEMLRIEHIKLVERTVKLYNSVAVVLAIESHKGTYLEIKYENIYRMCRTWKFERNKWILLAVAKSLV